MMVSPEWYAEEFLKGKTPEEILAKIKELEREIRRLRRVTVSPNYKNRTTMICPDAKVQLEMTQEYLKIAKQLYMGSITYADTP